MTHLWSGIHVAGMELGLKSPFIGSVYVTGFDGGFGC